jgi:ABC-type amino acid transport substrate-binding protein
MQGTTYECQFEVVWPLGRKAYADSDTVARVADLSGKTVAAVWDYLFRGDEMFDIVAQKLAARYPGIKFVPYETFGNVHGSRHRELVGALAEKLHLHEVDAVITSVGA